MSNAQERLLAEIKRSRENSFLRRSVLLNAMDELKDRNVGCSSCPGTCCTFVANSMQITPLEALDLYHFLKEKGLVNDTLWRDLEENILEYRLEGGAHVGAGRSFRRTYTCPFFAGKSLGCTISPAAKPYGCLAFNPARVLEKEGKSCSSDRSLLEQREHSLNENADNAEEVLNQKLRELLGLPWNKESIPVALISLRDHLSISP